MIGVYATVETPDLRTRHYVALENPHIQAGTCTLQNSLTKGTRFLLMTITTLGILKEKTLIKAKGLRIQNTLI